MQIKYIDMIQSLLTQEQYDELSKVYNTYNPSKRKSEKSEVIEIDGKQVSSGPPPNYIMGDSLTPKEIKIINKRLDEALAKVKIRYDENGLGIIQNLELTDFK
jgi:hypothetical protein